MELTHHIAYHTGGFLECIGQRQLKLAHGKQQTPVHRLQPVAHIRRERDMIVDMA